MEILQKPYRILIVDDDEEDYLLLTDYIAELGEDEYSFEWASSFSEGARKMQEARHDIYLIDHWLGAGTGIDLIKDATSKGCQTPKILLTGVGNLEIDRQAIKAGASDYLPKTLLNTEMLERTLRHAIEHYEQNILLKKAEKELLRAEQINLTSRMARIIAHEVRNPLTNINLATDELGSFIQNHEEALLYTEIIKRSSERINNLITDLLNSTRLAESVMVECNIEKIMNDVLLLCNDRIQLKKIKLSKSGFEEDTTLSGDPDKLKIAFVNIVTNAIEAMDLMAKPELRIDLDRSEKWVSIRISDNGHGMDENTKKHLFEAFFTGKNGGMGLGMTTVQNVILHHQGTVQVESEVSKGTQFIVRLPRHSGNT